MVFVSSHTMTTFFCLFLLILLTLDKNSPHQRAPPDILQWFPASLHCVQTSSVVDIIRHFVIIHLFLLTCYFLSLPLSVISLRAGTVCISYPKHIQFLAKYLVHSKHSINISLMNKLNE